MSAESCPVCAKPPEYCVCAAIKPEAVPYRVLVLRHPQESDALLGTAPLLKAMLPGTVVRTGLSWPNLARALGEAEAKPGEWGVLHLGGRDSLPKLTAPLTVLDRKGQVAPDQTAARAGLRGIILLDGSWAEAKALWWRNAWLLKCPRLVVMPARASLYGKLRREPRREAISTLEAAALTLAALTGDPELAERLSAPLKALVEKVKT